MSDTVARHFLVCAGGQLGLNELIELFRLDLVASGSTTPLASTNSKLAAYSGLSVALTLYVLPATISDAFTSSLRSTAD